MFDNMVCLCLYGPDGARGVRHNNPVRDFVIEAAQATPGYLPGPIEPGTWTLIPTAIVSDSEGIPRAFKF